MYILAFYVLLVMFACGPVSSARPCSSIALASWPLDMIAGFIPCSYSRLGIGRDSIGRGVCALSSIWTLALSPPISRHYAQSETSCGSSRIAHHRGLGPPDSPRRAWWYCLGQSRRQRQLGFFAVLPADTQPDSPGDQTSLASAVKDPGEDLSIHATTTGGSQTELVENSEAPGLLASRLQGMFDLPEEEAMSIINSQPALLSLPEEGLDGVVYTLKAFLDENEAGIITAVRKQPHLLSMGAKGLLPEKIDLLTGAGLTLAEARTVLKMSPEWCMVDLATIQRGVDLFREALECDPQEFAKVVTRMPSVLNTSPEILEVQCSFFINEMRLSTQQLRSWVTKNPKILLFSIADLRLKFAYFEGELGMSRLLLVKLVERQPQILALDLQHRIRPNVAYLKNELGIPLERLVGILVAVPGLLWFNIDDTLKRKVRWLSVELMLRRNQLRKIILRHPQVLTLSLEKNVGPKASWLKITLGIDDLALRDMIVRHPALLLYSIETVIKPKMSFLREEVGVEETRLRKLLVTTPVLFSYNVDSMRSKVSYLQKDLQFDSEDVARVISRAPQLLGYRVASMKAKVAFIVQVLHTNNEETRKIISGSPTILNLSIEKNLRLKIDLYMNELRGDPEDVRTAIVGSPSALGYSLTKRTRPRMQVMRLLGIEPNFEDHFWHLTSYTSLRFNKWLENQVISSVGAERRGDAEVRSRMKHYLSILHGTQRTV